MANDCCTAGGVTLLYTCGGASDVGELSDLAVRKLWKEGFANKTCLAGVGADISGFVQSAKGADINIVVDGCTLACARKCLERIGVSPVSVMLADIGFKKGASPVTEENIQKVVSAIKETAAKHAAQPAAVTEGG